MNKYYYKGQVLQFGKVVAENFESVTWASTERKARENICYQYKRKAGLTAKTKVSLAGKIVLEEAS